jgi:hypothetical protein
MIAFPISIVMAAWLNVPQQMPVARNELTVQALEAVAQISPHAPAQRQIKTPEVSFSLQIRFACMGDATPQLLSVGIADTLYRHVPVTGQRTLLARVDVPSEQIAPINIGDFCVAGRIGTNNALRLPGVATAQVSLRCDRKAPPVIQATSVALPLRLVCKQPDDQGTAADSPAR